MMQWVVRYESPYGLELFWCTTNLQKAIWIAEECFTKFNRVVIRQEFVPE